MEMDAAAPVAVTFFDFLEKMRNPAALHLVRSIKSFIVSFSFYVPNPDNDGKRVQEFFATMEAAISDHPLWAAATDEEIDCAMEGLEKYVMTKLFPRTFSASSEDFKIDNEVSDKIQLLQTFLRPEHLDIPEVLRNETSWLLAEKEFLKINSFKAPREKLQCIMSCCRVINNLLLNASMSENRVVGGADDFLPVLIYVTIKANPPQFHSNLRFIQLYRRQTKLVSESAYFFTSLISAKTFILELNASSLSIDEIEFEESMQQARSTSNVVQKDALAGMGEAVATPHFGPSTAMNSLHTKSTNRSNFPYMDKEPGQLTVEDVPRLLSLYKDVVTRYTNLRNAMGLTTISRRDSPRPILRRPDETSSPRMEQTDSLSSSGANTEVDVET